MLQSRDCKTDQGHERRHQRAMNAPLKALEGSGVHPSGAKGASDLPALMRQIGRDARTAARVLALAPAAQKNKALAGMAKAIRGGSSAILAANREDQAEAKAAGATPAFRSEERRVGEEGGAR